MCINDETKFCFPTSGRGTLKPRSHRNATQRKKTQHGAACCGTSVRTLPAQRGLLRLSVSLGAVASATNTTLCNAHERYHP